MLVEHALSLFDEGMALPHVIEQVLSNAGERQCDVGATIVRAALAMPDYSGHHICTPIKREIGSGCVEVGDTIITIIGSPCDGYQGERQKRILLWIGETRPAKAPDDSPHTTCYQLSLFVAQIVTLRAVGARHTERDWLAAIPA